MHVWGQTVVEVTRMRVRRREVALTGEAQASDLRAGKIEGSAEALREQHS